MASISQELDKHQFGKSHKFLFSIIDNQPITYTEKGVSKVAELPFKLFIPCESIREDYFDISSYEFKAMGKTFKIPLNEKALGLDIVFFDDIDHGLSKYLIAWKKFVFPENGRVRPVLSAGVCKKVSSQKLKNNNSDAEYNEYDIFPEGKLTFQGTGSPAPLVKSMSFVIIDSKEI
jgi:hypothetical protein